MSIREFKMTSLGHIISYGTELLWAVYPPEFPRSPSWASFSPSSPYLSLLNNSVLGAQCGRERERMVLQSRKREKKKKLLEIKHKMPLV